MEVIRRHLQQHGSGLGGGTPQDGAEAHSNVMTEGLP